VKVTVVWATPHLQDVVAVELTPGATIVDAVRRSGLVAQYGLDPTTLRCARYGVRATADACLAEGDRVEITRALLVDPKVARARRACLKAPAPRALHAGADGVK
jgi:hypothetical protein